MTCSCTTVGDGAVLRVWYGNVRLFADPSLGGARKRRQMQAHSSD